MYLKVIRNLNQNVNVKSKLYYEKYNIYFIL